MGRSSCYPRRQAATRTNNRPGQTFYEGVDDEHTISENASRSEPAKILVFPVKDSGAADARKTTSGNAP